MKKIIVSLFCVLMLLTLTGCNNNDDTPYQIDAELLEKGAELYDNKDYVQAYEILAPEAEKGSAEAKYYVGRILAQGLGMDANPELGIQYLNESVEAGYALAYIGLGNLYLDDAEIDGVDYDLQKAKEYFQKAADNDIVYGYFNLGYCAVAEQEYEKAVEYYEKAADMGNAIAPYFVGQTYHIYLGNYEKALVWYQKAIDECKDYYKGLAYNNVGCMYEEGAGVEQDYAKAMEYYEKAAEVGQPAGYWSIGYLYDEGLGVEQDYNKAKEYYELAIENGCEDARADYEALLEKMNNN